VISGRQRLFKYESSEENLDLQAMAAGKCLLYLLSCAALVQIATSYCTHDALTYYALFFVGFTL
jgi:hypothetical protein